MGLSSPSAREEGGEMSGIGVGLPGNGQPPSYAPRAAHAALVTNEIKIGAASLNDISWREASWHLAAKSSASALLPAFFD